MELCGVVVEGQKLGRKLGFPTANIEVGEEVNVLNGVYFSRVFIDGIEYRAVTNVGNNPTVGGVARRAESYILGFEGDLYGCTLNITLIKMLRKECKFDSVESLKCQVLKDIEQVSKF